MPKVRDFRIAPDGSFQVQGVVVPEADSGPVAPAQPQTPSERQLRLARRTAMRHGIPFEDAEEAVEALRIRGIDPFAKTDPFGRVPATEAPAKKARTWKGKWADKIARKPRDTALLRGGGPVWLRLLLFVILPTALTALYFGLVATPTYTAQSQFTVHRVDGGAAAGLGERSVDPGAVNRADVLAIRDYLLSPAAFQRLDAELGFASHFADPSIDWLQRLPAGHGWDDAFAAYLDRIEIGEDPDAGVLRLEVTAADPEISAAMNEALLGYAEQEVAQIALRLQADRLAQASAAHAEAERQMLDAEARVQGLLERRAALSTDGASGTNLAQITAEIGAAQMELQTRQLALQQAARRKQMIQMEDTGPARALSVLVAPTVPDAPRHPRIAENTTMAFLIFSGVYLAITLTGSILREQAKARPLTAGETS